MSATDLQALLRFLTQDAKLPLATAMSKVKPLQESYLDSAQALANTKPGDLSAIFPDDEKTRKQIVSAAKRVAKKRAAGDAEPSPKKKARTGGSMFEVKDELTPAQLEKELALPRHEVGEEELEKVVLFTNRAPLVLAFIVVLLKYSMPEQPLSSRLSLAQTYVSVTSRSRAVSLGIESGESAEQQGFGEGQPVVTIMGKELKVLRRWGYEWNHEDETSEPQPEGATQETLKAEDENRPQGEEEKPALWGLDLEAFKKSNPSAPSTLAKAQSASTTNMPIHTPQSARAYLLKAFDSAPSDDSSKPAARKPSAASKVAEKERNLGMLLRAIDLVFQSWRSVLMPEELDGRVWGWYCKVRPAVEQGAAGWGGKNELKLAEILALRRTPEVKGSAP